jgi:hypothetical protein
MIRTCDGCGDLFDAEACPRCGHRPPRKVIGGPPPGKKNARARPPDPDLPPVGVDFELLAEEEEDLEAPQAPAAGARVCAVCGKVYGPDYADPFCVCGVELTPTAPPAAVPGSPTRVVPPPSGTVCLVLLGPDRQPVRFFPINKDVTTIGRADPLHGHFPDIDVGAWLSEEMARKVSRNHALILRQRQGNTFLLRPLSGNTGTQFNQDMVAAMHDYPLVPGTRLILGGAVRLRFEVT